MRVPRPHLGPPTPVCTCGRSTIECTETGIARGMCHLRMNKAIGGSSGAVIMIADGLALRVGERRPPVDNVNVEGRCTECQ